VNRKNTEKSGMAGFLLIKIEKSVRG